MAASTSAASSEPSAREVPSEASNRLSSFVDEAPLSAERASAATARGSGTDASGWEDGSVCSSAWAASASSSPTATVATSSATEDGEEGGTGVSGVGDSASAAPIAPESASTPATAATATFADKGAFRTILAMSSQFIAIFVSRRTRRCQRFPGARSALPRKYSHQAPGGKCAPDNQHRRATGFTAGFRLRCRSVRRRFGGDARRFGAANARMCGCAAIPQTRLVSPLPCALRSHQRIALRRPNPPSRHATTRRPFATLLTASPTFHHAFVTLSSRPFVTPRVAVRDFGPKMATKPRSGTKRRGPGAPAEGALGKRPGREFRTRARGGRSVPERGFVAIFRSFSRTGQDRQLSDAPKRKIQPAEPPPPRPDGPPMPISLWQ